MSGGGAHDAEAGGSKGPTYWEMECESSEDEMEEADAGHQNVEDASTTDGGDVEKPQTVEPAASKIPLSQRSPGRIGP